MTFAPDMLKQKNMPVCKKHGYIGPDCIECYNEKYVVMERDKFLNIMRVLRDVLKKANLTMGVDVAEKIIEQETLKP